MHGLTKDSLDWFNVTDEERCALGTRLHDAGYIVYFGNVRGTVNSRTFMNGNDAETNAELFWRFSLSEIGNRDVRAMVQAAYRDFLRFYDECRKVSIVAYGEGSAELLISLSRSTYAEYYVSQAVLLAPCPIPRLTYLFPQLDNGNYVPGLDRVDFFVSESQQRNVYSYLGPQWENQLPETFCFDIFTGNPLVEDDEYCDNFEVIPRGPMAGGDDSLGTIDELGLHTLRHIAQMDSF